MPLAGSLQTVYPLYRSGRFLLKWDQRERMVTKIARLIR